MQQKYFDIWEFKQSLDLYITNPIECKNRLEKYIKKYPEDYSGYTYYSSALIMLGMFDEAEEILKHIQIIYESFSNSPKSKERAKHIHDHIVFSKIKLLLFQEKYDELYDYYLENIDAMKKNDISHIIPYIKKKKGVLENNLREEKRYLVRQIIEYKEEDFLDHIRKHIQDNDNSFNLTSENYFFKDFPLEKVLEEIKKYIPSDKCLFPGFFDNIYFFKYDSCGKEKNKTVNYFKVVCFHNTKDLITIYPCSGYENLPYIDLNYMINQEEKPKVKKISQIDKFNKRFNIN